MVAACDIDWALLAAILSAIAAILAIVVSLIIFYGQEKVSKLIHKEQQDLSQKLSSKQDDLTNKIYADQKLMLQRQIIVPLWEYMSDLNLIDPKKPITSHILKASNTMELVSLCSEASVADEQIILRTFRIEFKRLYESILKVDEIPGYDPPLSGKQLLSENFATTEFYKKNNGIRIELK